MSGYYPAPSSNVANEQNQYQQGQTAWQQQRNAALQGSAQGLEKELAEQPNYQKGIKLVAPGTNLYVRNYVTFHSAQYDRDNAIPLIAVPQKLNDVMKSPAPAHMLPASLTESIFDKPNELAKPAILETAAPSHLPEPLSIAPTGSQ
jgi:hypothetical protein